jgi:hypothetical protein
LLEFDPVEIVGDDPDRMRVAFQEFCEERLQTEVVHPGDCNRISPDIRALLLP